MSEITMLRGRLAKAEQEQRRLRMDGKTLVMSLRQALNQFEPDPSNLPLDRIANDATRLHAVGEELREVNKVIKEMQAELG